MGNFSRDPKTRLADSTTKHYVGVRMQQGVPILDADWNELEDLRRHEFEDINARFIGNGVPAGNDGFFIFNVSQTNDFGIRQGVCLVKGRLAENDADVRYTTQPNFNNPRLDEPLSSLTTPTTDKQFIVYLDVWEREVNTLEDPVLLDSRIGVETAIRLKREWAVRVARVPEDLTKLDNPPAGHAFYRLARLNRKANNANITKDMIEDLRDTQLSIQRKIEVRDTTNIVVVDNNRFRRMLEDTRNNVLGFIRYITTQFNAATTLLTSAEILGLQAAEHIASTAESGLGLVNAESLANRGALTFLSQIYNAENNFMTIWRDVVLQLSGPSTGAKKYGSYQGFITGLDQRLHQATVGTLTGLLPALQAGDLAAATAMQEEIARQFGTASGTVPRGSIQVFLAKSPPGTLTPGQTVRFEFRVHSFTTLAGTYTVTVLPAAGWPRLVVDPSSGIPIPNNRISIGSSGSEMTIFVDVTVQSGSSGLQLRVTSDQNPTEIDQLTSLFTLAAGQPAPVGEDKVQIHLSGEFFNATRNAQTGVVSIQRGVQGQIGIRVYNYTDSDLSFNLAIEAQNAVGGWTPGFSGTSVLPVPKRSSETTPGSAPKVVTVTPSADAVSAQIRVTATTTLAGSTVTSQLVIPVAAT